MSSSGLQSRQDCRNHNKGEKMIKITKEEVMELISNYFPSEMESCPMNAESFCNVLLSYNSEDIDNLGHNFTTIGCTDERWCIRCGEEDHIIKQDMKKCNDEPTSRSRDPH